MSWTDKWSVVFYKWSFCNDMEDVGTYCVSQAKSYGKWLSTPYCDDRRPFMCKITDKTPPENEIYESGICPTVANVSWVNIIKRSKFCYAVKGYPKLNWYSF